MGPGQGGVPREQKMLKGHLLIVIHHQVYKFAKKKTRLVSCTSSGRAILGEFDLPDMRRVAKTAYKGTSLIRSPPPVGPYSSPMPRYLW